MRVVVRIPRAVPALITVFACACSESGGGDDAATEKPDAASHVDSGFDAALIDAAPPPPDATMDALRDAALGEPGEHADADAGAIDAQPPDAALAVVCEVTAPTVCPTPAPSYAADVAPIFAARCTSCHGRTWMGPWPLDTYSHVADWEDEIRAAMLACTMPPADAGVVMPNSERLTILNWLRCDLPR